MGKATAQRDDQRAGLAWSYPDPLGDTIFSAIGSGVIHTAMDLNRRVSYVPEFDHQLGLFREIPSSLRSSNRYTRPGLGMTGLDPEDIDFPSMDPLDLGVLREEQVSGKRWVEAE